MPVRALTLSALALALAVPARAQQAAPAPAPAIAPAPKDAAADTKVPLEEIRRYVAVYNAIKQAYVEPIDDAKLMRSAIRGLLFKVETKVSA